MSRRNWIVVLVGIGVVIALVIGFAARSQSSAETEYCDALTSLKASVGNLTTIDPKTATEGEFQSDLNDVQSDWNSLESAAQNLHDSNQSALQTAWDNYSQAVKNIPGNASVSAAQSSVSQSAQALESAVKTSISSYSCSTSSSS
jgi:hypothetical protein